MQNHRVRFLSTLKTMCMERSLRAGRTCCSGAARLSPAPGYDWRDPRYQRMVCWKAWSLPRCSLCYRCWACTLSVIVRVMNWRRKTNYVISRVLRQWTNFISRLGHHCKFLWMSPSFPMQKMRKGLKLNAFVTGWRAQFLLNCVRFPLTAVFRPFNSMKKGTLLHSLLNGQETEVRFTRQPAPSPRRRCTSRSSIMVAFPVTICVSPGVSRNGWRVGFCALRCTVFAGLPEDAANCGVMAQATTLPKISSSPKLPGLRHLFAELF